MKKALLILLAATSLVACTKNDDDMNPQSTKSAPVPGEQAPTVVKKITPAEKVPAQPRHESTPVKTRG